MSKLRDRIRRTFQSRAAPLGFAPRDRGADAHRYLLVMAEVAGPGEAAAAAAAGADALLRRGGADGFAAFAAAAGGLPAGARVEAARAADADALIEAGADFLVFDDARTEAAALFREELGHVGLLADAEAGDDDLRLLQPLDLDALLIPAREGPLRVRDQLRVRRIAELARKPLIAPVDADAAAETLRVWRDAGAPVVLASGADADALARLAAAARAVPAPRARSTERPDPLVPATARGGHDEDEED